jgi:hypothetical protein
VRRYIAQAEFFIQMDFPSVKFFQVNGHVFLQRAMKKAPPGEGQGLLHDKPL